jgi:hypothetical protein
MNYDRVKGKRYTAHGTHGTRYTAHGELVIFPSWEGAGVGK